MVLPCPELRADLGFAEVYTPSEFDRIKRGLIPIEMEDKWFMFFEDPWLFAHRSWTGICIYAVKFESSPTAASAVESWVNRDPQQYRGTSLEHDRALLKFLIDAFLLGRQCVFPMPMDVSKDLPHGVVQHALVGRAYPESRVDAVRPPKRSFWEWIRKRRQS